jgi:AGZA family xanthine/uracil permease-like MFS transporter
MPFGIDTPSLFAMVFGVLGPAMLLTGDPMRAWRIGMGVTVAMGALKLALAFTGDWARRIVPRAALLGSIAGVAILLIAFLPAQRLFSDPLIGIVSLVLVLVTMIGGVRLPWGVPGALAAVLAGSVIFWARSLVAGVSPGPPVALAVGLAVPWPTLDWLRGLGDALPYLSLALPFALVTVVGGIDNTESASVAGDEYRTRDILLVEAVATMVAGACGGVIQNTPYIGHPAYKAMGARAGYTLATGLVIGAGAAVGAVSLLVGLLPAAAVAPILVFIGLEITAQAFVASPPRHAPAVAVSFIPAVAAVMLIQANEILGAAGKSAADLVGDGRLTFATLLVMGNGFVLTALVWGSALAAIIDRRLGPAAAVLAAGGVATLFGLIHSPLPSGAVFWPWSATGTTPLAVAAGYGVSAALLLVLAPRARAGAKALDP